MADIKIMISSRCKTKIKDGSNWVELSTIRKQLKNEIENFEVFGKKIFKVWISEEPIPSDMNENSWNECMNNVKDSNVLIVLYTGEGGSSKNSGDIGICHAELETAYNLEPGKSFLLDIRSALDPSYLVVNDDVNKRFQKYIDRINRFYASANDKETIIKKSKEIIAEALIKLVDLGKRETRKGKYNAGIALDWSRMNFAERKKKIEEIITSQLDPAKQNTFDEVMVVYTIKSTKLLLCCHGIPDSMSTPAASELVGQPFLKDYKYIQGQGKNINGPIHIIGVHKSITEKQAVNMLGVPDVISVKGPFGIYIVDRIQKIQVVFLENCREEASTRHNVQRFIEWILETGEDNKIIERAKDRKKIADLILSINK